MTEEVVDVEEVGEARRCWGCPNALPPGAAKQRRYCSDACRQRIKDRRKKRGTSENRGRSFRRPLPDVARDSGWGLRKEVERLESIFADDRLPIYKQQVATQLRSHLQYAAEVCQDLLSRINHSPGG